MHSSGNNEPFKIESTGLRYTWTAYHIFVIFSSLIGDTLILYASFQRGAFQLNKLIVTVIQYIAVSELTCAVVAVLPGVTSLIANTWVLGDVMCYITFYCGYLIWLAGNFLIAILTSSKFLLLKYPLRASTWSRRVLHRVCSLALLLPLIFLGIMLVVDRGDVGFEYSYYSCRYRFTAHIWKNLLPGISIITFIIPNIVIVTTTVLTLRYACKCANRVNVNVKWQGILPVVLTAVAYCISTLPSFVYYLVKGFVKQQDPAGSIFLSHFHRVSDTMLLINIMSNFYIYTLTISSFRRFLIAKLLSNVASLPPAVLHAVRGIISSGEFVFPFFAILRDSISLSYTC